MMMPITTRCWKLEGVCNTRTVAMSLRRPDGTKRTTVVTMDELLDLALVLKLLGITEKLP